MSAPVLEPYATQQRWQAAAPLPGREWQALLAGYLAALARACDAAGPCIIGHIKALALFDGGGYARFSAVSAAHPPTVDGSVPDGLDALSLTLNVLVYGLPAARLQDLTWETVAALVEGGAVNVTEEERAETHAHHPHHD
ncbi:MAG: hypothetical protein GX597_07065 [Anaerolineaceae bacterium]|nr:hypothetical protein [Anaerolineaceae bacterium]